MGKTLSVRDKERRAFLKGYKQGVKAYAVWKDGIEKVGMFQQDLDKVFREIEQGKDTYFEAGWDDYRSVYPE